MKIVMLTSDYLPAIGGIATHIYQLASKLEALGNEVEVWYWPRDGKVVNPNDMGDIKVRLLTGDQHGASSRRHARALAQSINRENKQFQTDIFHVHTMDALLPTVRILKRSCNAKFVWTNHTSRFLRKVDSLFWRWKMRRETAGFDGLLTASAERLEASDFLTIPHRLNVPNGVDMELFSGGERGDARRALDIEDRTFVILYTGRFAPVKGVTYLARALVELNDELEDFLCIFCGNIDGDRESQEVQDILIAGDADKRARFEGFIPNGQLKPYLSACDVLALPSLMEATSISALEAMAASRAIVGTNIGGIAELVEEGKNGFLVAAGSSGEFCRGLLKAARSDRLDEMGHQGYLKAANGYTWKHTAEKIQQFYTELPEPP